MKVTDCYRVANFRELARRRLPAPIFHYYLFREPFDLPNISGFVKAR